ncbi:MAG: sugar ABC transporter substrate-binding protein [Sphaerochaetaceae bacterium]|jgi:alpha-1,4-digalacturonate transport system substrate-binding protein|nr:sugar ABC transporter substrate-binding protein [Spirochaetaceae bacterium]MDY6344474.1 sugar ABC transporter substrate-binding protein [Sphaerochaetaceae bacterium]
MRRVLAVLVSALVMAASLFANGGSEAPKASGSGTQKDVTLSVLWFNDGDESEVFKATMQDYLAQHPNIKLDMQIVAYSDYQQKLKMLISGGNPPDVARMSTGDLVALIDTALPLDGYTDVGKVKEEFMPSMLAYAYNREGKVVALPTEATANGMLVNKTAFKNAGIDIDAVSKSWTWADWEKVVKQVIAANPEMKYGLAVDFTPHRFSTILYQNGGHWLNADQTGMEFDNPGSVKMLQWFKRMHDENLIPKSVWLGSENPAELFQAGLVACHIGGSWNVNTYSKNIANFDWGCVRMPKADIRSSVPGGKLLASFKGCAHPQEAVDFMLAAADKQHSEAYDKATKNLGARNDSSIAYDSNTEDFAVFTDELKVTPAVTANEWKNPNFAKVATYAKEQIVQYLLGNIDVQTCVANVDKRGAQYFK